MIYKKFNAKSLCILFIFLLSFFAFFSDIKTVSASETGQVFNADIIVESDSETGQSMIEANFNKSVKIEKFGDLNYVFLKTVDEGVIQNLSLKYNNYNVGCLTIDSATTLFTISDTNLSKEYIASAYIDVMGSNVTFKLSIDISSMTSINESLLEIEERPAEYVPVLSYSDSTDFDTRNQGSSVTLPTAEGKIATIICDISIEVYYQAGTKKVAVNVVDNQFTITNAGNYYIYYIASSDSYQTSLGNNTTSIEEFKLFSLSNGGGLILFMKTKKV